MSEHFPTHSHETVFPDVFDDEVTSRDALEETVLEHESNNIAQLESLEVELKERLAGLNEQLPDKHAEYPAITEARGRRDESVSTKQMRLDFKQQLRRNASHDSPALGGESRENDVVAQINATNIAHIVRKFAVNHPSTVEQVAA